MHDFAARGRTNPEKAVTQQGFREHFVKGIIEDDLPFIFGEKHGMRACFAYILPKGYTIPSHSTVRRDLSLLYTAMERRLIEMLQVSCGSFVTVCIIG